MENTYQSEKHVINVHSRYGLGDALIDFIFFSKIHKYIDEHNIHINYHCNVRHHSNLMEYNSSPNIHLLPYNNIGYELWQGSEYLNSGKYIEDILCDMFNKFLRHHNIDIQLDTFECNEQDLLIKKVESKYDGELDIIFINSTPKSGQFDHNKEELNNFIVELNKKYKIAVTEYLNEDILSFHELSVRSIAEISKKVKTIIAINTGPSLGLYNTEVLDAIDNIYLLDTTQHYRFKTRKLTKTRKISDLHFLLN